MGSSAWTPRRRSIRRPIVCKSKAPPEADGYPNQLSVSLNWNWIYMPGPCNSNKAGGVTCRRIGESRLYHGLTTDTAGRRVTCFIELLLKPNRCTLLGTVEPPPGACLWTFRGDGEGWTRAVPWTMAMAPIYPTPAGAIGSWQMTITSVP